LLAANGWTSAHVVARGDVVRIPPPASRGESGGGGPLLTGTAQPTATPAAPAPAAVSAPAAAPASAGVAPQLSAPVAALVPTVQTLPPAEKPPPPPAEPVYARQTDSNALLPVAAPTGNPDTTDYSVRADGTTIVQAAETLGHFADWCQVDAQALRTLNKLHKKGMVTLGRKIKLDLSKVTAAEVVAARRSYHRQLQETFFAAHRIAGTDSYSVKRGESLWTIAQHAELPIWLAAEYNPDVDFSDVRPGTTITLPRVVAINRQ
jgi:membrane-bound lytic murein transglycosylase D